ncbi:bifunctional copper resistance protein CopD/cytochrome c oxidase assembly protein [Corynebacterium sp. zg-331]|uniref:cytochrome c oxidase assembly protein n=1 Tax=unclassified Corynebacterium TaxID=2624378 RepID=UPI00128BE809|nr:MULTISPECIES: cytochrome c oxidase assembly protein [unclassified Corynebacterium]MBC3185012.1 bifunctional copper resistance protein CopD/cytochrome c oxidase assembly protein [Corynebacterium sp. zg-331]MPV51512.1 copper resistance protein [Corynebacterium sp. zg331]
MTALAAPEPQRRSQARLSWPLYLLFSLVAGGVGAAISWGFLSESLAALGIPDPGRLTTAGLPFFRAVGWMMASLGVGSFLASAFLIAPRPEPILQARLSVDGHIAARTGSWSILCFGLVALLMIPLTLSDVSGTPFAQTLRPEAWGLAISQVSTALAWLWVALICAVVGGLGLWSHRWASQPWLLVGAILTVIPLGMEGHSAAGGDHDYGTNSYLWHLIFLVLWMGGLMALIAHGRRLGPHLDVAVHRYSALALVAVIFMAASGLINAAIRIEFSDWFTTTYGRIIVAKTAGVIVLAFFGFLHRQLTIPQLRRDATRSSAFLRVAIAEVLVMAAVTGIAITMGRTPPPPPRDPNLSPMAIAIGFDLHQRPTFWNVWGMWRFDLMFATIAILLAAAYLWGVVRLRCAGASWPWSRTAWFLLGCLTLGAMMSSGMGMNMMALFSMHMLVHMGLSMVVPVFLVLGAPLTLVMETVPPAAPGCPPGLHEWAWALCHNRVIGFITAPGVNTVQFIVIFYLLYLTPLYDVLVSEHGGHVGMNMVFLISGYLYFWDMISPDPVPRRGTPVARIGWLIFSMPFHLYFGVYLMQLTDILAGDFYSSLGLPWEPDLLEDQRIGGGIAWASGAFPLVIVFSALFRQWRREEEKKASDYDRRAEAEGDVDMENYNAMLARMNAGDSPQNDAYYTEEFGAGKKR